MELGVAMGVDPKKVLIGDNGQIFEFDKDGGVKVAMYKRVLSSLMALVLAMLVISLSRDRQQLAQKAWLSLLWPWILLPVPSFAGPDLGISWLRPICT